MELNLNERTLVFIQAPLQFTETNITNVFAKKNNKTLRETIEHHRYSKLSSNVETRYAGF